MNTPSEDDATWDLVEEVGRIVELVEETFGKGHPIAAMYDQRDEDQPPDREHLHAIKDAFYALDAAVIDRVFNGWKTDFQRITREKHQAYGTGTLMRFLTMEYLGGARGSMTCFEYIATDRRGTRVLIPEGERLERVVADLYRLADLLADRGREIISDPRGVLRDGGRV